MHQAAFAAINNFRRLLETPIVEQDGPEYESTKGCFLLTRASIEIFH